ncbi:MAG: 1-(5-phosphoribosyl)-5-[(5-phosphoribosylamino)methylideneamino] imidazole-4-carboxamide isomerase, partial [Candidatus Omnitrophota bacterium]
MKDNKVVRLFQGDYSKQTDYPDRPEDVAQRFEEAGAQRLHVVDLDGALKGEPANLGGLERILGRVRIPVEFGGGIRDPKMIQMCLELGAQWVILGTKACLDEGFLREAAADFGERVIIGVDAKNGYVATDGWTKISKTHASDLIDLAGGCGVRTVIYTDIERDGALRGPNLKAVCAIARKTTLDVIASGGFACSHDLERLMELKPANVTGVIIGKALYENKFSLPE